MKYRVVTWGKRSIIAEDLPLAAAKKQARGLGYDADINNGKWFAPIAFVEDENGFCVYNPRFKMEAANEQ